MKKIILSLLMVTVLVSCVTFSVRAADAKSLSFTASAKEIKKGDEVTLTLSSKELTGIEGNISYDSSIWTLTNKTSNNVFTVNDQTGKFVLTNTDGQKNISATITLKSKTSSKAKSGTITISNILGSDGESETGYNISNKSVTIKFKTDGTKKEDTTTKDYSEKKKETKKTKTTKKATKKITLPQTGVEMIVPAIILLVTISGIVSFIKIKKNKEI